MSRDTVWQDDPPFAVESAAGIPAAEPATDEEISLWDSNRVMWIDETTLGKLFARIKAERASTKSAIDAYNKVQELLRSEREQTIRECAAVVSELFNEDEDYGRASDAGDAILSLLQSKEQLMTDDIPMPTGETTVETPTGQLRFVYTQLPDGRAAKILQQQIATLSYRDDNAVAKSFRWQDVPCVDGN